MLNTAPGCFAHMPALVSISPRRRRDNAASTWSRRARARASSLLRDGRPARDALRLGVLVHGLTLLRALARRIRWRRRSPDSRCSGSSSRRDVRGWYHGSGRRRAPSSSCAVSSIAGVQKPHCSALRRRKASCRSAIAPESDTPSMVSTLRAVALHREREAAAHDRAVEQHRAGAAHAVLAADMAAGQPERLAQEIDQRGARLDGSRRPPRRSRSCGCRRAHARGSASCFATRRSSTPARCFFTAPVAWMSSAGSRSSALTASSTEPAASAASALRARTGVAPTPK